MFLIFLWRYQIAFSRSSTAGFPPFLPWRQMYRSAVPRQKSLSYPHASMTLIASYGLSAPP